MITPGELWFGRTAGTRVRLSSRRICRGGALSPPAVHGLMEVLYGPTDMSARTRSVEGGTTGGHTGPPLRDHRSAQQPQRGGTEPAPYGCNAGGAQQRADAGIGPYGEKGKFQQPPGPAAHSGASAARMRGMGGDRSRDHPKGTINAGQSLSQPVADSSLYTREPLGTGDADRRVGPAGLLAMTMDFCHSEERSDVGICPFYDGRWTGGRAAEVVGPYGKSTEVPAAGRCGHRPLRNEVGSRRDLPGSA